MTSPADAAPASLRQAPTSTLPRIVIPGDKASAARSQAYYLDVTHPLANKGEVVKTLARRLNIAPPQIATMGDMPNDVLMFRQSGFSIAMGNASDEVKAQASAIIDSNENDGFAKAVRQFILPPQRRMTS